LFFDKLSSNAEGGFFGFFYLLDKLSSDADQIFNLTHSSHAFHALVNDSRSLSQS
jgi:hypothetical protein